MHRRCLLCRFCALLLIHIEAVAKCQMVNQPDVPVSAGFHQQNAFYALRSCHQILHGDRGEFFSPDYLCSNPSLWCNWTIQVHPGKRVQLYLVDLTSEHECHLKTDQIHLGETPVSAGESRVLERCWRSTVYTSYSNTVHVVQLIRSNPNPPHRGFYGVYQAFGLPETPDPKEDESEEGGIEDAKAEDTAMKIPRSEGFSDELEENHDAHIDYMEVSHSIDPQQDDVLTVTTGSFREVRKIRGDAKDRASSFRDDLDDLLSVPTEMPNWIIEDETPTTTWFDDGTPNLTSTRTTHSSSTSTRTTHSSSTSTGTTLTPSVKRRKAVPTQLSTVTATTSRNGVTHHSPALDDPTRTNATDPSTPLVGEFLKTVSAAASKEPVSGLTEDRLTSKKIKQSHEFKGKSLPVQTFRLATEAPLIPGDCGRPQVPTLLYAVCFLLCFLIALLLAALGVMYRRFHHGTFLPRCRNSRRYTDTDVNNNDSPNSGSSARPLPPPPPPLHVPGGTHDLPLLRFSPLTPLHGFEGEPQKEKDVN